MAIHQPNYIWRKGVTPKWLEQNAERLTRETEGTHAVVELPTRKGILLECFCPTIRKANQLVATFGGTTQRLPKNWFERFSRASPSKPLRVGQRLVIANGGEAVASRGSRREGRSRLLIIPAGAAFGTGEHATTAMSLRILERISRRLPTGWRMLDAGTGSGILALAAKCFDAAQVVAIDNDPTAISTARSNAKANGIRGVKFVVGDVGQNVDGRFEVIAANLYSELLVALFPQFRVSLSARGHLILSGVLRRQEPEVVRALRANRFRIDEARRCGKWIALRCSGDL